MTEGLFVWYFYTGLLMIMFATVIYEIVVHDIMPNLRII